MIKISLLFIDKESLHIPVSLQRRSHLSIGESRGTTCGTLNGKPILEAFKVCQLIAVGSPRPGQVRDMALLTVETDGNIEERGNRRDDRTDIWRGRATNWSIKWFSVAGQSLISLLGALSHSIRSDRGTHDAIGS